MEDRYFGLHITRTAGTSLSDLALRVLGRSQCLMLSSFAQLQRDNEQTPQERSFAPLPLFSFGHFVHESLWGMKLSIGPVFSFTVLREPRSRLQSTIRHYLTLGRDRENIRIDLLRHPNPTCVEILRCVPVARLLFRDRPLHVQALAALSAFDRVVKIEQLPDLTADLLRRWGSAPAGGIGRLNAAHESTGDLLFSESDMDRFVHEDQLLWDSLDQDNWRQDGDKVIGAIRDLYSDQEASLELFRIHLDRYMRDELRVLNIREQYLADLTQRRAQIDRLLNKL